MSFSSRLLSKRINFLLQRSASSKPKPQVTLDESVRNDIENEVIKPKKHPGVFKIPMVSLPEKVIKSIDNAIGDSSRKHLLIDSKVFSRFLHSRLPPTEKAEKIKKLKEFSREIDEKYASAGVDLSNLTEDETRYYEGNKKSEVDTLMKQRIYNWKALEYTQYLSLVYLVSRSAPEYAVVLRALTEISKRDPDFSPSTVFDFGSGVGTVLWATSTLWPGKTSEFLCVDISSFMNDLSLKIVETSFPELKHKIFYRQFLPASPDRKYDLVVSSYSFLDLASAKTREQVLLNLWSKTTKYLALMEFGTLAGFRVLSEARQIILSQNDCNGHVFAPCPHDLGCPRIAKDNTPCNFETRYSTFTLPPSVRSELFSFVIFKKGEKEPSNEWPRIIRPPLLRSRHVICRMCTSQGSLVEVTFSPAKHGKTAYRCARKSSWGDFLPLTVQEMEHQEETEEDS